MNITEVFLKKQELNKFLSENPHLKPMQKTIDEMMRGAGNSNNRMVLLCEMMKDHVSKLQDALKALAKIY